jgi:hypothetical protein
MALKPKLPAIDWVLFFRLLPYVLLVVGTVVVLRHWGAAQTATVQQRMDTAQAGAAQQSSHEAIEIQSRAADRDAGSERLSRTNESEIRHAKGADARIDIDAHTTGLRALCRREAYRDNPRCGVFRAHP